MKKLPNWRLLSLVTLAFGAIVGVACSGDDDVSDAPIGTNDAGKDVASGQDTGTGPTADTGTDTGSDTSTPPQGVPPGCFSGTPVNSLDFLNACTDAAYVVFDNCARLGYCDGGLPALVTPTVDAGPDVVDSGTDSPSDAPADG